MEARGRDIVIPKKVETWLGEHGIHGTPSEMHSQVTKIQFQTQDKVDDLLRSVSGTHRSKSATRFLEELRNAYGKVVDDIVTGTDVTKKTSTIVDRRGNPIQVVKDVDVPYKHKEPVFVPMKNMSQEMEQRLGEINELLLKSKTEGLTLTELNKTKRIGDQILNIYDRSGDVKAGITAEKLSGLRSSVRGHIETIAKKNGIPDIKELNKQTQVSLLTRKHFEDIIGTVDARSAIGDQIIFLMGLTGTVATGGVAPLVGAGAVVGGREIARLPRVRTFIGTRMSLLMEDDFKTLKRGVTTGVKNRKFWDIVRKERKLLQGAFPELRIAGKIQEKAKEVESK